MPRNDKPTTKIIRDQILADGGNSTILVQELKDIDKLFQVINKESSNLSIQERIKDSIRKIVKDKNTAENLIPKIPFFGKRPLVMDDYFQVCFSLRGAVFVH